MQQVVRFACVKVGGAQCRNVRNGEIREPGVPILQSDVEANAFIIEAIQFIGVSENVLQQDRPPVNDLTPISEAPGGPPSSFDRVVAACEAHGVTIEMDSPRALLRQCNERIVRARTDAARKTVGKPLAVRALNLGANTIHGLTITQYNGDGVNQQTYQAQRVHPLSLLSGEIRVLAAEPDPAHPGRDRLIFNEPFIMDDLTPGVPFARAFMLRQRCRLLLLPAQCEQPGSTEYTRTTGAARRRDAGSELRAATASRTGHVDHCCGRPLRCP
jgi:hypothetical protein